MGAEESAARRARRGWSIRLWLVLANAVILGVVVTAIGTVAWRNGDSAVDDLASQVQRRASAQVETHLQGYLDSSHRVVRLMIDAVELGMVDFDRPDTVYQLLFRLARAFPELSYLNFGLADARFFGLGRVDNGSEALVIEEPRPPALDILYQYAVEPDGRRGAPAGQKPSSDHRQQSWYEQPARSREPVWTSVYAWVDNPEIVVVSAGQAFGEPLAGVAGVDLFLSRIGDFLAGLKISEGARSFIVERDGTLVALSTRELPFVTTGGEVHRLHAAQAGDLAIRQAWGFLQSRPGGIAGIRTAEDYEYGADGRWYLTVTPWQDPRGLDWLIVVTVPESDFTRTIVANTLRTVLVGVLALLAAVLVSLGIADFVVRRLRAVEDAARVIAGGELGTRVAASGFSELNRLAASFNAMSERLGDAFARLERGQAELEEQVAARTAELQHANAELARLAREDGLTLLANRRHLDIRLREEWLRARRSGEPLSVLLCDVDHFKAYNDRYGHGPGDEALRKVGAVLARACRRAGDVAARYGGEEFALLLPGIDADNAMAIAAAIREQVHELAVPHEASPMGCITLSFGVACQSGDAIYPTPEQLVKAADQALYAAKHAGRDRAEQAPPPGPGDASEG